MKQKKLMPYDPEIVQKKLHHSFINMKLRHIHKTLRRAGVPQSVVDTLTELQRGSMEKFREDYKIHPKSIQANRDLFDVTVVWLYMHDFSINQIMKYQGCAQSKVYKSLERLERWMDESERVPFYEYLYFTTLDLEQYDSHLDNMIKNLHLLQHRPL